MYKEFCSEFSNERSDKLLIHIIFLLFDNDNKLININ